MTNSTGTIQGVSAPENVVLKDLYGIPIENIRLKTRVDIFFPGTCASVVDLAFVIDSSGSIEEKGVGNWNLVLRFVSDVVNRFIIGRDSVRVALVRYGENANIEFHLNEYYNNGQMVTRILSTGYLDQRTNTADGIQILHEQVFQFNNGDRNGVDNVGIIITDGESNVRAGDVAGQAATARARGIRLIAVGVTDSVNMDELNSIANSPADVITVDDFSTLTSRLDEILQFACPTPGPAPIPSPSPGTG